MRDGHGNYVHNKMRSRGFSLKKCCEDTKQKERTEWVMSVLNYSEELGVVDIPFSVS